MSWAAVYLICFVFGFTFSALSLLTGLGHLHLPVKWHLPHSGFHGPQGVPHGGTGGVHGGFGHGPAHPPATTAAGADLGTHSPAVSPVNFFTLMAFLTWFGGTGYLLTQYSRLWFALALLIASASGVAGAAVIFVFLTRVALRHEASRESEDFSMIGMLGRLTISIREGGTGEMIYSHDGTRHTCGARSEDGVAIPKGTEVVVTRYERGLAYVRRWDDMARRVE